MAEGAWLQPCPLASGGYPQTYVYKGFVTIFVRGCSLASVWMELQ